MFVLTSAFIPRVSNNFMTFSKLETEVFSLENIEIFERNNIIQSTTPTVILYYGHMYMAAL